MTDEELAADDATRFRAGIEQLLEASKSLSRTNKLDGLTLRQFCERLLDPVAFVDPKTLAEAQARLRAERRGVA